MPQVVGAFLSGIDLSAALWAFSSAFAVVIGATCPAKEYRSIMDAAGAFLVLRLRLHERVFIVPRRLQ